MAKSRTKAKTHYTHEERGVCRPTADKWYDCAKQLLYQTWDKSTLAEKKAARLQTLEMLRAYLDGEFINLTTGTISDRFDRAKHVITELPNIDSEPLRVGIDFNVTNMSAVIGIRSGNGLVIIDEISGAHDTRCTRR
jgi:hypothetical protein